MSEPLAVDEITLRVPASPTYARVLRVGATAVALRSGMSFADIDELRAAIDATLQAVLQSPASNGAALVCHFKSTNECLELQISRSDARALRAPNLVGLDDRVTGSAVEFSFEPKDGSVLLHLKSTDNSPS